MKTNTRNQIENIIKTQFPIGVTKIANILGLSNEIIHRHINKLTSEGKIYKTGTPPKVYYFPTLLQESTLIVNLSEEDEDFLEYNFLEFSPNGSLSYGVEGFYKWCEKRGLDTEKEIIYYKQILEKYNSFKNKNGFIDGIKKLSQTFDKVYLDEIYYLDFYSIEKYGKTLLGNLMFYGKQSGDKEIIAKILSIIKNPIIDFAKHNNIDCYGFIPPSIDRKIQLMTELKKGLNLGLKEIKLIKIFKDKVVSQKSLSKTSDRIINANETIFIENSDIIANKILLIDDAVGSGATLNQTAKKIKERGISNYVIGIAIVGSYKGFEVINEV